MGKSLDWVREEPTGRLIFRRAYPEAIRQFLDKPGQRELKVPLGAKRFMTIAAMRTYEQAKRQFDANVERAKASQTLLAKQAAGAFDKLDADLSDFLVAAWKVENLELDEWARWKDRPREIKVRGAAVLRAGVQEDLREALELRALGDLDTIVAHWGRGAADFGQLHGFRLDESAAGFRQYVRAFHDATIEGWEAILKRLDGIAVPTPTLPPEPRQERAQASPGAADQQTYQEIVEGLFEATRNQMSETTKEGVRTALRLFREANGTPTPAEITRAMVSDWLDLLAQRPAKLEKADRPLPLPQLVERYRDRPDVPRLSPKTVAQHLTMLGARWPRAKKTGRIGELANPFADHDLERSKARRKPLGFSDAEASAIFSLPVFTRGERPRGGKGEASYFLPLILLFTGARPEEIAQLLVSDVIQDPTSGRWLLRITDEGEHPHKGPQSLKTSKVQSGRRTFPIPQTLLDLGLLAYVRALQRAKEAALFPQLRTKGKRGMLYAGFGDWWRGYLVDNGIVLEGEGRQPMRETRHTWSTAARRCDIRREQMAYIQGHALEDATSGEGYGDQAPLAAAIDRFSYPWFDALGVKPWTAH